MKAALIHIKGLTWYHWCCLVIPFIRVAEVASTDLVPKFAQYGYTYQDAWYYVWSRLLEAMLFYTAFRHTKLSVFVFVTTLSILKIFDEKNTPFNFSISEVFAWVIAILVTVLYNQSNHTTKHER